MYPQMRLMAGLPGSRRTSSERREKQHVIRCNRDLILKANQGETAAISGLHPTGRRLHTFIRALWRCI
jgi:hypothetical protein